MHTHTDTGMVVRGLAVARSCFVVWSGKCARVYRVDSQMHNVEALEPFTTPGGAMAIADVNQILDEALFVAEKDMVRIVNFQGTQRGSISFTETEGNPEKVDINGQFLAVVTNFGVVKMLDVNTPTRPKLLGSAGRFLDPLTGVSIGSKLPLPATLLQLSVRSIKVNCDGSRVALLTDQVEGALQVRHADSRLHVFDRNKGGVVAYDFTNSQRTPVNVVWDDADDRLLCCEAVKNRSSVSALTSGTKKKNDGQSVESESVGGGTKVSMDLDGESSVEVVIFFATTEHGLLMQDSFGRRPPFGSLMAISVPRIFFRNFPVKDSEEDSKCSNVDAPKVFSKVMRDFVGMDEVDTMTKMALLDFSYNLTLGKLDEAYKAVKAIDSPSIWENMAQMCVKTKRLDVAEVCLGNMGHARGAAALRESRKEDNLEVSVGVLAIQLGLCDDAARLFREAGRQDKLNDLYQCGGLWDKAVKIATTTDRIHMRTTHFNFARHLESIGDVDAAIQHYENSDTARTEVPRMLFDLGRVEDLEDYVHRSDDAVLLKWWAAYLESNELFDKACKYYRRAGDYLSLVRISCFKVFFAFDGVH